jgi:YD repeat-containing protein
MGEDTTYGYDEARRLTDIIYFNSGDPVNPVKTVTFTFDKVGNLIGYDDGTTSATYTYDDLHRKIVETVNFGGFSKTFNYEHYHNGLKKRFVMPDNIGYDYTYDDANQLVNVQIPDVGAITVTSYHWNRPDSVSLPGGSKQEYTYDPLMRVKSITDKDPAQNVFMQYSYTYDKMDNITSKATWQGIQNYTYDDLYRLTASDHPVDADESFTYDAVGNRLTSAETTDTWSYNLNNELQGFDTVWYDYDANGNMIQKTDAGVVTKFFYNLEDRLERVEDGVGTVIATYYYDPFGRRLWKEVSGVRTYFLYADEGLIGEYDSGGN